jgi:hypothetical protein
LLRYLSFNLSQSTKSISSSHLMVMQEARTPQRNDQLIYHQQWWLI